MKINDSIQVLDDDISGIITAINGDAVTIVSDDGFEIDFEASQIIVVDTLLANDAFKGISKNQILAEKATKKTNRSIKTKPKERQKPTMEVDLHIHQLVSSEKGLTAHDKLNIQIDTAKRQLEFAISKKIQRVVFIHGIGAGVLRAELEYLFRRYDQVSYEDADYQKYGRGATMIFIRQNSSL